MPISWTPLRPAYAAKGSFQKAVQTARRAIVIANEQQNTQLASEIQDRLKKYSQKKPHEERL